MNLLLDLILFNLDFVLNQLSEAVQFPTYHFVRNAATTMLLIAYRPWRVTMPVKSGVEQPCSKGQKLCAHRGFGFSVFVNSDQGLIAEA